jgi:excisionase family DNA binding protein
MERLMTVCDVADVLRLHPNTVYKLVNSGQIPSIKRNGLGIRFRMDDVKLWLNDGTQQSLAVLDNLRKFDLPLDRYDRLLLRRRTELNGITRFNYGIGSVILRKTKRKEERFYIDYQIDGRRTRKAVKGARTRADALKVLNAEVSDAFREKHGFKKAVPDLSFLEMGNLYMERYSKPKKKSWKTTDRVFLGPLERAFGDFKLGNLKPEMVEDYMAKRLADGLKPCSVNREVSCLRTIYNVAISWGYVSENPVKKVKLFSEKENIRERVLLADEETKLLAGSSPHLRPILEVALHTGMRKGEIFSLRWEHLDLERGEVRIVRSKSGKGRVVSMNSALLALLRTLKAEAGVNEHVFVNPETGKPYVDVKRAFQTACRRAGIKDLRFHDLRHTFASRLVKKGVDLILVMELMGHASVITTQRYTHSQAAEKKRAVELLCGKALEPVQECQTGVKPNPILVEPNPLTHSFSNN